MSLIEIGTRLLRRVVGKDAKLNEFQQRALQVMEKHADKDVNFLVVAPTGGGKTLVGATAIAAFGKGFYLAPLRSLMKEKYLELRKMFEPEGKKIVITNKDYSIPRRKLKEADIRVLSPYKMMIYLDLVRPEDGVVVVDEIHKIHSDPQMEAAITALKVAGFRIVALSATIHESDIDKMCRWLNAVPIVAKSERPVPLRFAEIKLQLVPGALVVERGSGILPEGAEFGSRYEVIAAVVNELLRRDPGAGVMVWTPTRREADEIAKFVAGTRPTVLPGYSRRIIVGNEHDNALRFAIERGVGIHHGGLSARNREIVEELFAKRLLNVVVTCYTLSHGVNLPVRYLVFSTIKDYEGRFLDPSTFHQIAGRAGRPGLDEFGEVVVITVGELESYVYTKLLSENATRVHSRIYDRWTLTKLAAQRLALDGTLDGFVRFLKETYYAYEHGPQGLRELRELGEEVLANVVETYFVVEGNRFYPKDRATAVAAAMGLHPREWWVHETAITGDYRSTVLRACRAAMEALNIDDPEVQDVVLSYGLLASVVGGMKARDVAEMTQTILDAVAVYVRRVYGWNSQEFRNAVRIAEAFAYGGNPNAEELAKVLRHDEMKRLLRSVPQIVLALNVGPENVLEYVQMGVRVIFELKKRIYLRRVYRVVDAMLRAMLGDVPQTIRDRARRAAYEEVRRIASETGAQVI